MAEAVGVALPPVMRANQGRFDHLLDELIKLKTEVERIRGAKTNPFLLCSLFSARLREVSSFSFNVPA